MQDRKLIDLKDVVNHQAAPPACDITLKIEVEDAQDGRATTIWKPDESFVNGVGVVMGGYVSSAADITMAYAISSILEENQTFGSINLNTTFHRAVFPGEVIVHATVKKQGRSVSYVEAELFQNEKLVATATSSVSIRPL
ncbi:PaaI family thioesterase [Aliibacillus thermotolerans]|uniref:PaaI family thioesterase n=1 Tax=Aliibacillus thermotolerans TaxID=1834418 RepID=A0ABW0U5B8_9BACI|nr:PaaI family thioesterase [Aliibacillus thermotolerans]MDA3129026.1 hotdog fold thioesterase [Aliibacillus thermotolerans]